MEIPAICNGCGRESPAWDRLCTECSKEVVCKNCKQVYKRGQGLQDVDLCARCVNEAYQEEPEEFDLDDSGDITDRDDSDYGFDLHWELYDK